MARGEPMTLEQFKKAWPQTKATMEIEGFVMTPEDKEAIRKVCMGEMSRDELIKQLKGDKIVFNKNL